MKDRLKIWFVFPLMFIMVFYVNINLDYQIIDLNKRIINFIPSKNTCLGCCSLECLKEVLIDTIKLKNFFPFFSIFFFILSIITFGIYSYLEIKKEKLEAK